ncbi:MAG: DEAD/DEAH box helicase [Nitrospinae bacterium]|nr:DEAD/DEAH box helicase [Nitrospinota bacterium]
MKFESLNLDPKILSAITEMGYEKCTPVQEQALPESLAGNDVAVQAQTGTGKTAVFLVTALRRWNSRRSSFAKTSTTAPSPYSAAWGTTSRKGRFQAARR